MKTILPEINFLNTNPEVITKEVIETYEEVEGRKLAEGDPLRIIFLAMASVIAKMNVNINDAAKQNLLYYSRNDVLDHKGNAWTTPRLESKSATSSIRLHMSQPQANANIIKKGTLLTTDEAQVMFRTTKEISIMPLEPHIDIDIECTESGVIGNGFDIGEINTLINPIAYIDKVENTTVSSGGTNREKDDDYRTRVRQAPEKLSTAGPDGAYEYFARSASSDISDVKIGSTEPGVVDIKILLKGGALPSHEIIEDVYSAVSSRKVRPLTDKVEVGSPVVINYDLDMSYYINSESTDKILIQEAIEESINKYIVWQSSRIGRDINPSKLISACIEAGAKRVEIRSPIFTSIDNSSVSQLNLKTIVFGGIEDD